MGLIYPVTLIEGHQSGFPGRVCQLNFTAGGAILIACFYHYIADRPSINKIPHAWGMQYLQVPSVNLFIDRNILINPEPAPQSEVSELE